MTKQLKAGIIGLGYISPSHIEAIRRTGIAGIYGCADVNPDLAGEKASKYRIPKVYKDAGEMIHDPEIDVIHNCTPNYLHKEYNAMAIKAGKHLFSEKPLARSTAESAELLDLLKENPEVVTAVNFNYRMNPLVQDMRVRIANNEIGRPRLVHGSYLQDWLLKESDYSWRLEKDISGESNTIADIGSHWMDIVQHVLGARINAVLANLITNVPVRKKPTARVEAFATGNEGKTTDIKVEVEDFASVMFTMDNGTQGLFYVSQVSAGRKCYLNFEINGEKSSFYWNQENADQMWIGHRDRPNELVHRNPGFMDPSIQDYTYLAAGHPEGWNDAMTNNVKEFYSFILDGKKPGKDSHNFAGFEDAHYILVLIEAILESHKKKTWVRI